MGDRKENSLAFNLGCGLEAIAIDLSHFGIGLERRYVNKYYKNRFFAGKGEQRSEVERERAKF